MTVDHRGHLLRLGLEAAQLVAVIATVVGIAKHGLNMSTLGLLAVTVVLSIWLHRTPRPPLSGDHEH